jgi:hypothetical protein
MRRRGTYEVQAQGRISNSRRGKNQHRSSYLIHRRVEAAAEVAAEEEEAVEEEETADPDEDRTHPKRTNRKRTGKRTGRTDFTALIRVNFRLRLV